MRISLFTITGLLALSPILHAVTMDPLFQVRLDPSVYKPSDFQARGFAASAMPGNTRNPSSLPTHAERESLFDKVAGLREGIQNLDELDRDLLVLRARRKSFEDLKAKYPKVPVEALRDLQTLVKS